MQIMNKLKCFWQKTNRWHWVIFIFLIVELRLVPKNQLGFECNDPSLSHPYTGDTISWKWLLASVVLLPLAVLLITERIQCNDNKKERSKQQALKWYKEYLFGVLINLTVVQTLKIVVGAPRPHFFDSCNPEEANSCSGREFVSSYTCTKSRWVDQPDTSFPSGHTALALHTGIFIAYYLHQRCNNSKSILVGKLASVSCAVLCAVSRVSDRRHHWRDVLAGAAISIPILLYTIVHLCKNFRCGDSNEGPNENIHKDDNKKEVTDLNFQ